MVSGERAVRCSDTVYPAALNDRSLTALEAGIANSCRASVASFGRTSPTVLLMRFLWLYDDDAALQTIYRALIVIKL